jgi:hypothetical protein
MVAVVADARALYLPQSRFGEWHESDPVVGGLDGLVLRSGDGRCVQSFLPKAPDDPRAITVKGVGDGKADDTDAVQKAIDAARDGTGHGLVFLPSGRYRLSRSILVPPACGCSASARRGRPSCWAPIRRASRKAWAR